MATKKGNKLVLLSIFCKGTLSFPKRVNQKPKIQYLNARIFCSQMSWLLILSLRVRFQKEKAKSRLLLIDFFVLFAFRGLACTWICEASSILKTMVRPISSSTIYLTKSMIYFDYIFSFGCFFSPKIDKYPEFLITIYIHKADILHVRFIIIYV